MNFRRRIVKNLQTHIIAFFSMLLFFSFFAVGLTFNIAVNLYLSRSATDALSQARDIHIVNNIRHPGGLMRIVRGNTQFFIRSVPSFDINENYAIQVTETTIMGGFVAQDARRLAEHMAETSFPLVPTEAVRIRLDEQMFYLSIMPIGGESQVFTVFYLDITDILQFTAVVNRVLVLLVAVIWLISIILTGFMADSLVKPLRKLRDFVRQIGKGDFTQNNFEFVSEEFRELNQSINQAAKQLATYDNDQKDFFQNVSHELRTPLMSIKSYAEGIKYNIMDPDEASGIILQATDKLTEMVDDILYVSRIDSLTTPDMHRSNLTAIVAGRVSHQKPVAVSHGLDLKLISNDEPVMVNCVPSYIERAIDNLIVNSLRYATNLITVELYPEGDQAIIRVVDDGPGFEPGAIPHVFERFYRGKNGITGIGLAIVKSITEQHKGTATAENGSDCGAILTISLPRL